jgi:hypothetical protein
MGKSGLDDWFDRIYYMDKNSIDNNFIYIGEGISRATYAISDDFVAKFATCMDGIDQCKLEYTIYKNCGKSIRKHLCPVVWYRSGMIVMRRAKPLTEITEITTIDINRMGFDEKSMKELKYTIKKYNLLYEDILATSSWGELDKRPVLIDYGCTN